MTESEKAAALYHVVRDHEGFEVAARQLYDIVRQAADEWPDKPRILYVDIEGHRTSAGGFDHDMSELQQSFIPQLLMPYLSEVHMPLLHARNESPQRNDLPPEFTIQPPASPQVQE